MPPQTVASVSPDRLADLHSGQVETTNLVECLAIDFVLLAAAVAPGEGFFVDSGLGITRRMEAAGRFFGWRESWTIHSSDTVRGWMAFALAAQPTFRLQQMRPLAADRHFGVREWAWLAARPWIAGHLPEALNELEEWTRDPSPFVRRFASESTRPRGVWCSHLAELKQDPARALQILEPLRADPSPYVQDSVANWLHDAWKSQPAWVETLVDRWSKDSPSSSTARIIRRALRSKKSK